MTLIKVKNENGNRYTDRIPMFSEMFNNLFDNVLSPNVNFSRWNAPAVNISETNDNFTLSLVSPGLNKEDFKVNVENDMITISAEKENEVNEKNSKFTRKEFSFSSFSRSFTLPELVDSEKISASYENGILNLVIPKKEEAKPKPIREIKIS